MVNEKSCGPKRVKQTPIAFLLVFPPASYLCMKAYLEQRRGKLNPSLLARALLTRDSRNIKYGRDH